MLLTDSSCLFVSFYLWYSADILSSVLFACVVNQFLKPHFSNPISWICYISNNATNALYKFEFPISSLNIFLLVKHSPS